MGLFSKYILLSIMLLNLNTKVLASDLPEIKFGEGQGDAVIKEFGSHALLCGPDGFTPRGTLSKQAKYFVGKNQEGVLIAGVNTKEIYEWVHILKTDELNSKLNAVAQKSTLFLVSLDSAQKLNLKRFDFGSAKTEISQSYTSCVQDGPKNFQCGSSNRDNLKVCCGGTSKFFGFEVIWKTASTDDGKWKIKYGHGNGMPVFKLNSKGKDEPMRFCHGVRIAN